MILIKDVAKYFISFSKRNNSYSITQSKLQKLLYYAQGYHYVSQGKPLFPEDFIAMENGPVNIEVFNTYKKFKYLPINEENIEYPLAPICKVDLDTINKVWMKYGALDGKTLEELVNQEDPLLYTNLKDVINKKAIKSFFLEEFKG